MTAADEFCRASAVYRNALRYGARSGSAFEVGKARHRSGWWIFWACALLVLAAITLGGM